MQLTASAKSRYIFMLHSNKLIIQWHFHTTPKYTGTHSFSIRNNNLQLVWCCFGLAETMMMLWNGCGCLKMCEREHVCCVENFINETIGTSSITTYLEYFMVFQWHRHLKSISEGNEVFSYRFFVYYDGK